MSPFAYLRQVGALYFVLPWGRCPTGAEEDRSSSLKTLHPVRKPATPQEGNFSPKDDNRATERAPLRMPTPIYSKINLYNLLLPALHHKSIIFINPSSV